VYSPATVRITTRIAAPKPLLRAFWLWERSLGFILFSFLRTHARTSRPAIYDATWVLKLNFCTPKPLISH
jgi:hypothetical protein